jgi:putative ABC transport system permease protein
MKLSYSRAALRVARREARRHRGRSALVIGMIAVPVLGLTAADVTARSAQLDRNESITRLMGQADAKLAKIADEPVLQAPDGDYFSTRAPASAGPDTGEPAAPPTSAPARQQSLGQLLPAGTRLFSDASVRLRMSTRDGGVQNVSLRQVAYGDPILRGLVAQRSGRAPRTKTEVVLSPALMRSTGLHIGQQLTILAPVRKLTVVGTAIDPNFIRESYAIALPGAVFAPPAERDGVFYADTPGPVGWNAVQELNKSGLLVQSRAVMRNPPNVGPPPASVALAQATTVGLVTVAAGLAVLEVVLLAGAAFAVGAKRQRRELAIVAATGADAKQVRALVLAGGVVLGAIGAAIGVVLGLAVAALARSHIEHASGKLLGHYDVRPLELVVALAIGVLAGVIAAVLPARAAARQDVVAALAGRRGTVRTPRSLPVIGIGAVAAGAAYAWWSSSHASFRGILIGAVVAELGFVACAPALVAVAGRLAGPLPLPIRLALRDASRHRTRTGPAVAAVMAALAGSIAVSVYLASDAQRQRAAYIPEALKGQTTVVVDQGADVNAVIATVSRLMAVKRAYPLAEAAGRRNPRFSNTNVQAPPENDCASLPPAEARRNKYCTGNFPYRPLVMIGGTDVVTAIAGYSNSTAATAIRDGAAVVVVPQLIDRTGHVTITVDPETGSNGRIIKLRAVLVPERGLQLAGAVVISPAVADRYDLGRAVRRIVFETDRLPTTREEDRASAAVTAMPFVVNLSVERGYQSKIGAGLLALLLGSAVVTIGATAVATGLASADGRPDLATLGAVGASPRLRRTLAASQSATVAFLGAALGVVAGVIPAAAVLSARTDYPIVLPWTTFIWAVVAVPAFAAVATAVCTRSRLPLDRRLA